MRMFNKYEQIVVISHVRKVKSTCDVCGFYARDTDDLKSIGKEGACTECVLNFKHVMNDDWKKGLRPTQEVARAKMNIFMCEV